MALRRGLFTRFAVSLQYHGSPFLGFSWQPHQEDMILPDGTDLRGYRTVEGRLRDALFEFFGRMRARVKHRQHDNGRIRLLDDGTPGNDVCADELPPFENIQVSSRTDRGVHALHNTLHVDILNQANGEAWSPQSLHRGLNFHLSRQCLSTFDEAPGRVDNHFSRRSPRNEMRILNVQQAPSSMVNTFCEQDSSPKSELDWNARFSATERMYIYRILHSTSGEQDWGAPFEWDRSWRIYKPLDLSAMQEAASFLEGTHDVSSFRTAGCQRRSPIVTLAEVSVHTQPYGPAGSDETNAGLGLLHFIPHPSDSLLLTTIVVRGNAFVYRQVRNMVGCLVAVGMGQMDAQAIPALLACRDRRKAPSMAPAHGLFLARVRHGDFDF